VSLGVLRLAEQAGFSTGLAMASNLIMLVSFASALGSCSISGVTSFIGAAISYCAKD
jgi:hypothetical protein